MSNIRFKTKQGLCTPYALACGYGDEYRSGYDCRCSHYQHADTYHVKIHGLHCDNVITGTQHGYGDTRYYWAIYESLAEARKAYNLAKREVDKFIPR